QWRLALRHPALAALLGGQRLITHSGCWTTRRNTDRGAP
ncbi:MAG TPA: TIGR03750 family conjugal transfer protein, partial [Ottowia sp.]|nr:TIGR03750 family conjugal transfer protein [Ottowia sp.]